MKKIVLIFKRIIVGFLCFILIILIGLIINNRIITWKYSKLPTDGTTLRSDELGKISQIYSYLNKTGEEIFPALKENDIDLIIFNDKYEFLVSNQDESSSWDYIEKNDIINKRIYRRSSNNPQAFAVYLGNRWVGSMSTMNTYHKRIAKEIGLIFPPQFISIDGSEYIGAVIHEMTHAIQGRYNHERVLKSKSLHSINSRYYNDNKFNELITIEGFYLEQAIKASDREIAQENAVKFLETRSKRRSECKMSKKEINNEMDFEWLEGLARFAEYKASTDSKSLVRRNMDKIEQKAQLRNDDRYYTLGMAQALLLDKLQIDWKDRIFDKDFSLEDFIKISIDFYK